MARAQDHTLLSLDRYAKTMGINPLHFNGALTPALNPQVFPDTGCDSVWYQYDWQNNDQVSRDQLAMAIAGAEADVMAVIGFPPAPMWVEQEIRQYPADAMRGEPRRRSIAYDGLYYRRYGRLHVGGYDTLDNEGRVKAVKADFGRYIAGGQRALDTVGTATTAGGTLVYSDPDGDGFFELATITLPLPSTMTSLTDACEFKAFFDGETYPEWEIRYPRSATITGGNIVLVYDSWLLIDPDLWEAYPTSDGASAIDVSTTANFVTTVDVYREYVDTTGTMSTFYWDNGEQACNSSCSTCSGTGCEVCSYTTQNGCIIARDVNNGILVPHPATYDEDNGIWERDNYVNCNRPDFVKMWYRAGDQDRRYLAGRTCDPMPHIWAQVISWIATARLDREICACGAITAKFERLRHDLSKFSRQEPSYFQTDDIRNCPFGTLRGEVMAWRRIKKTFRGKILSVAVI